MKLLTTGAGTFLTGDRIAEAVVRFGASLANARRVDVVEIPFITDDGHTGQALLTIGLYTVVNAQDRRFEGVELEAPALLDEIARRTRALTPRGDTPLLPENLISLSELDHLL